jgi:hypothetical protein
MTESKGKIEFCNSFMKENKKLFQGSIANAETDIPEAYYFNLTRDQSAVEKSQQIKASFDEKKISTDLIRYNQTLLFVIYNNI